MTAGHVLFQAIVAVVHTAGCEKSGLHVDFG